MAVLAAVVRPWGERPHRHGAVWVVWRSSRARARREERPRFETLLSHLSTGLIRFPAAAMYGALERSLGEVGSVLGGDRGGLDELRGPGQRVHISWTVPGTPGSRQLRTSRHALAPVHAAARRGALLGVVALDAVQAERAWSDGLVRRLHLPTEAFGNAIERRRMEVAVGERLAFEQALSAVSTAVSAISGVEFGREVCDGLRRSVHVVDVDRAAVFEVSRDGDQSGLDDRRGRSGRGVSVACGPGSARRGRRPVSDRAAATPRETEVFARGVTGMLKKQIAGELGIGGDRQGAPRPVMEKMQARAVAELVRLADRAGVIVPAPAVAPGR